MWMTHCLWVKLIRITFVVNPRSGKTSDFMLPDEANQRLEKTSDLLDNLISSRLAYRGNRFVSLEIIDFD